MNMDAENTIQISDKEFKQFETLKTMFRHAMAENSGVYYICGESGHKDDNGLPEGISVCPAYGADFNTTVMYRKCNRTGADIDDEDASAYLRDLYNLFNTYNKIDHDNSWINSIKVVLQQCMAPSQYNVWEASLPEPRKGY
jgi:hypothetical protein